MQPSQQPENKGTGSLEFPSEGSSSSSELATEALFSQEKAPLSQVSATFDMGEMCPDLESWKRVLAIVQSSGQANHRSGAANHIRLAMSILKGFEPPASASPLVAELAAFSRELPNSSELLESIATGPNEEEPNKVLSTLSDAEAKKVFNSTVMRLAAETEYFRGPRN